MRMSRVILLSCVVAMALILGACPADKKKDEQDPAAGKEPAAAAATAIAEVNGKAIARSDFDRQFERTRDPFKQANREIPPALEMRLKENILRRLVEDELIAQKATSEGVALPDEEFEARFAEHRKRFGTDQAYGDFLKRTGQTEADLRHELRKSLMRERLYSKLVPDLEPGGEDAKNYYDQNQARYIEPEQVKASHILLKYSAQDADDVKKQKMDRCKKLFKQAKAKGADFAALAKEHSEGPTAPRGGDLGFFPRGRMVKEFEEVAFPAKAGAILGPVETQFGCHVIKVVEKKERRQREFDEVKASVVATLKAIQKSEKTRGLLNELRRSAEVKVLDPNLKYQVPPEPVRNPASVPAKPAMEPTPQPATATPMPKPAAQSASE